MNYYYTVCGFETFNYDLKQTDSIEVQKKYFKPFNEIYSHLC